MGISTTQLGGEDWDRQLSGPLKSYLGGTISVEARNMAVLTLLRIKHPLMESVLDVGCASGSFARSPGAEALDYTGIDISTVAINEGCRLSPSRRFQVAQLQEYVPDRSYDTIIFSEVLYYLSVNDAVLEHRRYSASLAADGIVVVSMKHDPKSESIMQAISRQSTWLTGLLFQEAADGPSWRIRPDAKRPAYLIGLFRP
jgi:2-polyprenyl-3-methyl-5-hydroxy-6-metoxy-1,4-benzoquinol methylase